MWSDEGLMAASGIWLGSEVWLWLLLGGGLVLIWSGGGIGWHVRSDGGRLGAYVYSAVLELVVILGG